MSNCEDVLEGREAEGGKGAMRNWMSKVQRRRRVGSVWRMDRRAGVDLDWYKVSITFE